MSSDKAEGVFEGSAFASDPRAKRPRSPPPDEDSFKSILSEDSSFSSCRHSPSMCGMSVLGAAMPIELPAASCGLTGEWSSSGEGEEESREGGQRAPLARRRPLMAAGGCPSSAQSARWAVRAEAMSTTPFFKGLSLSGRGSTASRAAPSAVLLSSQYIPRDQLAASGFSRRSSGQWTQPSLLEPPPPSYDNGVWRTVVISACAGGDADYSAHTDSNNIPAAPCSGRAAGDVLT